MKKRPAAAAAESGVGDKASQVMKKRPVAAAAESGVGDKASQAEGCVGDKASPAQSDARKVKYPKGGGAHPDSEESKRIFAAAQKIALERLSHDTTDDIATISRFTIAVEFAGVVPTQTEKRKYDQKLAEIVRTNVDQIATKPRRLLLSFSYQFACNEAPFCNLATEDWTKVFHYLTYSQVYFPNNNDSEGQAVQLCNGSVSFTCLIPNTYPTDRVRKVVENSTAVAGIFLNGTKCSMCSRYSRPEYAFAPFCCDTCRDSGGKEHSIACLGLETKLHPDCSGRLSMSTPPTFVQLMETQVEKQLAVQQFTERELRDLAAFVGFSRSPRAGAFHYGDVRTVTSQGRFVCQCLGSERVGCCVCSTKPMIKWCWYEHALSGQHIAQLEARSMTLSAPPVANKLLQPVASAPPALPQAAAAAAARSGSSDMERFERIRAWCVEHRLPPELMRALEEEDVEQPEDLMELSDEDLNDLCAKADVKKGIKGRFKYCVQALRVQRHTDPVV